MGSRGEAPRASLEPPPLDSRKISFLNIDTHPDSRKKENDQIIDMRMRNVDILIVLCQYFLVSILLLFCPFSKIVGKNILSA